MLIEVSVTWCCCVVCKVNVLITSYFLLHTRLSQPLSSNSITESLSVLLATPLLSALLHPIPAPAWKSQIKWQSFQCALPYLWNQLSDSLRLLCTNSILHFYFLSCMPVHLHHYDCHYPHSFSLPLQAKNFIFSINLSHHRLFIHHQSDWLHGCLFQIFVLNRFLF